MRIDNNEIFLLYIFIDDNNIILYIFNINKRKNLRNHFLVIQKSLFFQISRKRNNIDNIALQTFKFLISKKYILKLSLKNNAKKIVKTRSIVFLKFIYFICLISLFFIFIFIYHRCHFIFSFNNEFYKYFKSYYRRYLKKN